MQEILDREIVLDICPTSNLRTRVVPSIEEHPLRELVAFGIPCSISTDDPAMFDTDLTRDHQLAVSAGLAPGAIYEAGVRGALCEPDVLRNLDEIGRAQAWPARS